MRFWAAARGNYNGQHRFTEVIAQVRGTTAALAEAEQRVASFTSELAQQAPLAQPDAKLAEPSKTPIAKRGTSGWVPAG
jgi:hypothetical protein